MKSNASRVACIVLGAGSGIRFGGAKQLARFHGKFLLQNALDAANKSKADYVLLVLGEHSSEILEKIQLGRAQIVYNRDYETGIASSVKCGISNLPDDCSGAIIMVADQPFLESKHLDLMILDFVKTEGKNIVALSLKGEPRNPVLIPRELFPELNKLQGDSGAKELVRKSDRLELLEIGDSKVFTDIDTKKSLIDLGR